MKLRISKKLIVLVAIILSFVFTNNVFAGNYVYSYPTCSISYFIAGSNSIKQGDPVTLQWGTFGCHNVSLSNYGQVSLSGRATFYPNQDTSYTLRASNPFGSSVVSSVHIYIIPDVNTYVSYDKSGSVNQPGTPVVNNYYYPTTTKVLTANTLAPTPSPSTTNNIDTTNSNTKSSTSNNLGASAYNSVGQGNSLTALSLGGSGSFMPSSIWQWMLVVVLILIIIIIIRILINKPTPGTEAHAAPHAH